MAKLIRKSRASDVNMGIFNGENLNLQRHTEGPYAGHSVVQAAHGQTIERLKRDGWKVVEEEAPVEPAIPSALVPFGDVLSKGSLADLEAIITPELSTESLRAALEVEASGRNRKGARKILEGALAQLVGGVPAAPEEAAPAEDVSQVEEEGPSGPEAVHIAGEEP